MTNNDTPRLASFNDALTALADYALALRTDSNASDSTLDHLHMTIDDIINFDNLDPTTFPNHDIDPAATIDDLASLHTIAEYLFSLRP